MTAWDERKTYFFLYWIEIVLRKKYFITSTSNQWNEIVVVYLAFNLFLLVIY